MSAKEKLTDILERLTFKVTSGRFIFTIVVAGVYAFLACTGGLDENRIHEITLVVLYAYFNRDRTPTGVNDDNDDTDKEGKPKQ